MFNGKTKTKLVVHQRGGNGVAEILNVVNLVIRDNFLIGYDRSGSVIAIIPSSEVCIASIEEVLSVEEPLKNNK